MMTWETIDANGIVLNREIAMQALIRAIRRWDRGADDKWYWKCPRLQLDAALEKGFASCFTLRSNTAGIDTKFTNPDYRLCDFPVEVRYDMPEHQLELWDREKERLLAVICGIGFPHISA